MTDVDEHYLQGNVQDVCQIMDVETLSIKYPFTVYVLNEIAKLGVYNGVVMLPMEKGRAFIVPLLDNTVNLIKFKFTNAKLY